MKNFLRRYKYSLLVIISLVCLTLFLVNTNLIGFQANLLGKTHPSFDGLVAPVELVPNWVSLRSDEWKLRYDQFAHSNLISLPNYNPDELRKPFSSLNFSSENDRRIRNAQITFSVPYMGNYKLDGLEYAGSHPAVDIKLPMGTPIRSIGNGLIVKVSNISTGFGKHIVVRHNNFPSFENPSLKTTYFASYSHLDSISVVEGEVVLKGQIIGKSGISGTATTPHLHFQIDNNKAPWYPYWPFTSKEAYDAGLSFFEAINAGLGMEKALETTINPMVYVQRHLDSTNNISSSVGTSVSIPSSSVIDELPIVPTTPTINTPQTIPPVVSIATNDKSSFSTSSNSLDSFSTDEKIIEILDTIILDYEKQMEIGESYKVKVTVLGKSGLPMENVSERDEIAIKIVNGSATLDRTYLRNTDFNSGVAYFTIIPNSSHGLMFEVFTKDLKSQSDFVYPVSKNVSDEISLSDNINVKEIHLEAVNFLKTHNIMKGYSDGSLRLENDISRVEVLKMVYEGLNKPVKQSVTLRFSDTDSKAWYARYVAQAEKDGVVQGYHGNIFKPANPVTRAEFLKILIESAEIDISSVRLNRKPFSDVNANEWHAPYFAKAKEMSLIDVSSTLIKPNESIKRGEVAEILYKMILIKINGKNHFTTSLMASNSQAKSFFAN